MGMSLSSHALLIFADQLRHAIAMMETGLQHSKPSRINGVLLQKAHTQVATKSEGSFVPTLFPGEDVEQGRFTTAILRNQTDTIPLGQAKGDTIKQHQVAKRLGQILDLKYRLSHGLNTNH